MRHQQFPGVFRLRRRWDCGSKEIGDGGHSSIRDHRRKRKSLPVIADRDQQKR